MWFDVLWPCTFYLFIHLFIFRRDLSFSSFVFFSFLLLPSFIRHLLPPPRSSLPSSSLLSLLPSCSPSSTSFLYLPLPSFLLSFLPSFLLRLLLKRSPSRADSNVLTRRWRVLMTTFRQKRLTSDPRRGSSLNISCLLRCRVLPVFQESPSLARRLYLLF